MSLALSGSGPGGRFILAPEPRTAGPGRIRGTGALENRVWLLFFREIPAACFHVSGSICGLKQPVHPPRLGDFPPAKEGAQRHRFRHK